jgi:hypothetical protein
MALSVHRLMLMPRLMQIIAWLPALVLASPALANPLGGPAEDITVTSALTMAKDTAESAPQKGIRLLLRDRVAQAIMNTGQQAAFDNYVAGVFAAWERLRGLEAAPPERHAKREAEDRNHWRVAEAERAFLAGDASRARDILRECEFIPHGYYCMGHDHFINLQFLTWEAKAGNFPAVLHRLRTTEWKSDYLRVSVIMQVARAFIGMGRRWDGLDILRLAQSPGGDFEPCIVASGATGTAAQIRKLACDGNARAALDMALALQDIKARTIALAIMAEGLAGVPGLSDERLEP